MFLTLPHRLSPPFPVDISRYEKESFFIPCYILSFMKNTPDLKKVCEELGLPYVEEVEKLFKMFKEGGDTDGRPIPMVIGATIYIVARMNNFPLGFKEIAETLNVDKNDLITRTRSIMKKYGMKMQPTSVEAYAEMIARKLGLPDNVKEEAVSMTKNLEGKVPGNKLTILTACIYLLIKKYNLPITQIRLAKASNISTFAIRGMMRKIISSGLLPSDF